MVIFMYMLRVSSDDFGEFGELGVRQYFKGASIHPTFHWDATCQAHLLSDIWEMH